MSIISALSATTWFRLGPSPVHTPSVGLGMASGRIEAAAPHPSKVGTMYLAANGGGVWKTGVWTFGEDIVWLAVGDDQRSLNFAGYHPLVVHLADHSHVSRSRLRRWRGRAEINERWPDLGTAG